MKKTLYYVLVLLLLTSVGCKDDEVFIPPQEQLEIDIELIKTYLVENNIDAIEHESGIFYIIHREGTGDTPTSSSAVKVNYKGNVMGEEEFFDQGTDVSFPLTGVITGWQIGIPLLSEGGAGTFYIPSGYGYGRSGTGNIPGNAILVFRVDLLDVL